MVRSGYYDDPNAPRPQLAGRGDIGGRAGRPGENPDAAARRLRKLGAAGRRHGNGRVAHWLGGPRGQEETGFEVEVTGLVGTFTDPRHIIAYSDGQVRRQFNVCYTARIVGGEPAISDESAEMRFADPAELDALPMHPTQQLRLEHFLSHSDQPYLG